MKIVKTISELIAFADNCNLKTQIRAGYVFAENGDVLCKIS